MKVVEVSREERALYAQRIAALELDVTYPIGEDRFQIDHGADYFSFFDRLGTVVYHAVLDQEEVIAVGAGILRQVPPSRGLPPETVWYACDLKVRRDYRRRWVPFRMVLHGFPRHYPRCRRGYGITMNPSEGGEHAVLRMLDRYQVLPITVSPQLWLYSLDAPTMRRTASVLEEERGPLSYLSLGGIKDIVLQSTGAPMPLLHVQFGPCAEDGGIEPVDGHVHMFCTPSSDPLVPRLQQLGLEPSATASVVHHRMEAFDWRFILTSDI